MTRILIADDHPIVRRGVRDLLMDLPGSFIREAGSGDEVIACMDAEHWDLVLLDLAMPGRSGLDLIHHLVERWPRVPILVLSLAAPETYALRALRAGARGFVVKDAAADELLVAIKQVLSGRSYIGPEISDLVLGGLYPQDQEGSGSPLHLLSDREMEVLRHLGAGRTIGDIALELSLSVKTVSTYRTRLLEKLQLKSTHQLVRYAVENALV